MNYVSESEVVGASGLKSRSKLIVRNPQCFAFNMIAPRDTLQFYQINSIKLDI